MSSPKSKSRNIMLWTAQGLLAALFLFAGLMKLVGPVASMNLPVPLAFVRFIGVAEVAGALGLVLPGILRVWQALTPIAAIGLVLIMSGATVITIETTGLAPALIPLIVGTLATTIAVGRARPGIALRH